LSTNHHYSRRFYVASIKLKRITFPGDGVNVLGQPLKTLEMGERGKPVVEKLEYNPEQRMVVAEIENKGTVLFPIEQIANLVPMEREEEEYRVLTPDERLRKRMEETERSTVKLQEPPPAEPAPTGPTEEEAARIRAEFKAKQRELSKAAFGLPSESFDDVIDRSIKKVVEETVSTPVEDPPDEEHKEDVKIRPDLGLGSGLISKPKPKKRGRPKKKRG
jgi:hypothetical protein